LVGVEALAVLLEVEEHPHLVHRHFCLLLVEEAEQRLPRAARAALEGRVLVVN
jgi:hypothetical protein